MGTISPKALWVSSICQQQSPARAAARQSRVAPTIANAPERESGQASSKAS